MAMREVTTPENEGEFFKFTAIGDKLAGYFAEAYENEGQYGTNHNYKFVTKQGVMIFTAKSRALQLLTAADLKPGYKVILTYTANRDVGKESPLKLFKLQVDDEITEQAIAAIKGKAQAAPAKAAAKPAAKPEPKEEDPFAEDDDIAF